jgi:hypothetical protein
MFKLSKIASIPLFFLNATETWTTSWNPFIILLFSFHFFFEWNKLKSPPMKNVLQILSWHFYQAVFINREREKNINCDKEKHWKKCDHKKERNKEKILPSLSYRVFRKNEVKKWSSKNDYFEQIDK